MKWVITERVHYDRVAACWLIKRFIDKDGRAELLGRGARKYKEPTRCDDCDSERNVRRVD